MSVKEYLKAAKNALKDENYEYSIQLSQDALAIDPKNYIAYVFIGKSNHLLEKLNLAIKAYKTAIEIDSNNLTAWKGLELVLKNQGDYKAFFEFSGDYAEVLIDLQQPLSDFIKDITLYRKKYTSPEVYEEYLRSLLPYNKLGQVASGLLEKPEKVVNEYLDIKLKKESLEVTNKVSRERMRTKNLSVLDALSWDIYKNSEIPHLYEELINITDDNDQRRKAEEQYLKYRVKVLKVAPNELRESLFKSVKEMVDGLVLVKHTSYYTWLLYFDWLDPKDLSSIDQEVLTNFLKLFKSEPLGQIVHAFILSDLSTYKIDLKDDKKTTTTTKSVKQNDEDKDLQELQNEYGDDDNIALSSEELLALMKQGLESSKTSVFAHRIVSTYELHLKNFADCLNLCQTTVQLLASSIRSIGVQLPNTTTDVLVNLGVTLTYHEAPKNFKRALEVFDKVLKDFPTNVKARVGKGLILAERGDLESASELLEEVVETFPDNYEALSELSWVQVRQGHYEEGRQGLSKVLSSLTGNTLFILELKASTNWKIAQSYILEGSSIEKAYEHLVESLRASKNYAPSYSTLGEIYFKHYDDFKRATKCFLKAFELDASEVNAAWYLVKHFTENNDWQRASTFSERLLASDQARRRLGSNSWPYRILGCASLEAQDDARAVEWFQNSIRVDPTDTESWVGLGEAYYGCGRLEAAVKVFKKALELKNDHWVAKYLMSVVLSQIGEYDEAIEIQDDLLKQRPGENCVISALYDSLLKYASQAVSTGFFGKAVGLALRTVDVLQDGDKNSLNFWKITSDLVEIFLQVQSKLESFPHAKLLSLFETTSVQIDQELVDSYLANNKKVDLVSLVLVYSNEAVISLNPTARPLRSSALYNLGRSQVIAYLKTKTKSYRDSAIESLKQAIKLQNNYPEAWLILGVASMSVNPHVSQHCFIKASLLDPKNVEIWSDIALLYLKYGDSSLATEAYMKGQALAPSEPISWLGHALAAEAQGDNETAARLYTQAFILSNGRSPSAQLSYGVSICLKRIGKGDFVEDIEAVQEFSTACYGMLQYLKHFPRDVYGLSITCLILERLNDYELGKQVSSTLLGILEQSYEETEDEVLLSQFSRVKAQYARFELGLQNFEAAIESASECLELSQDEKTVVPARTVLALSYFFLDKFDDALDEFKEILNLSKDAKRLTVLISQVLFAYNTEETKQAALDQLFNNIETSGTSLLVTLVIGAISIIDNLEDYLVIIKSELESLPLAELLEDRFKNVPYIISQINKKLQENERSTWQRSAFYFPNDLLIWKKLDENIALKIASQGKVTSTDLSDAYLSSNNLASIQRSLFLAPWNVTGAEYLKGCFV